MDLETVTRPQVLSGVLGVVLVLGVLGLVGFAILPVPATPGDTAFYVVNESGTAAGYPTQPAVGEEVAVFVGVHNGEHREMTYELVARTASQQYEQRTVTLDDGETWERSLRLSFDEAGEKRISLYLYREGGSAESPYRELYLNFDVRNE